MTEIKSQDGRVRLKVTASTAPQIEAWEHGVIWKGVQAVNIDLGTAHWYGQGGLGHQQYPLEKIAQYPAPFMTSDNGRTGLLGILEPFWVNSEGVGIWVDDGGQGMITSFNAPLTGEPPEHSFYTPSPLNERPKLANSVQTDGLLRISGDKLLIRFLVAENVREVIEIYWQHIKQCPPPPLEYFEKPLWTTWAHLKSNISQAQIMAFSEEIAAHGFECGTLGIDDKWQRQYGDTHFDPAKFPDPKYMIDCLHENDIKVTLWCVPFFNTESQHFQAALAQNFVIKNPDGSPYIGDWWQGQAAFLDVTNPAAMHWHLDNLGGLAAGCGLDGFKFDAGEGMFYDIPNTVRHENGSPNLATQLYIEQVASRYAWSDIRAGWHSQGQPMLFRQWDKSSGWGFDNGLASCITQAITLNLLGYPYSFPDMIGGNRYGDQVVTAELLIRWTQAVAPMPIIQFSIPPWEFGEECALLCARYAGLHRELAAHTRQISGLIVRPVWWLAPQDEIALTCNDQYLIGDELLVAPIIHEGATSRDIYLPPGLWCSYWNADEQHQGGQWLIDYPAPLDVLPLFKRG